jgi:tRNA (adenine37-N6)-methyltransferase
MISLMPVGYVRSARLQPTDDGWDEEKAVIELAEGLGAECLEGIEAFSHVEVVYWFHEVGEAEIVTGARHPRGNPAWPKVGIFAQRGKGRPNRIGVSVAAIVGRRGNGLEVRGLDAIDGTPVLDVKPVMREFLPRGEIRQPDWVAELMAGYWSV